MPGFEELERNYKRNELALREAIEKASKPKHEQYEQELIKLLKTKPRK